MNSEKIIAKGITFDDVLLIPGETNIKPADVSTATRLTKSIKLGIPLISAGHDNITESAMAIAIAQLAAVRVQ